MTEIYNTDYYTKRSRSWKVPFLALCFILTLVGCALRWNSNDDSFTEHRVRNYITALLFFIPLLVLVSHYTKRPYPWLVAFGIWFWASPFPMADADFLDDKPDRSSDDRKQTAGQILMLIGAGLSLICFPWPFYRYEDRVAGGRGARVNRNHHTATATTDMTGTTDLPPTTGTGVAGPGATVVADRDAPYKKSPYLEYSPFSAVSLLLSLIVFIGCILFWDLIRRWDYPAYNSVEFEISIRSLWVILIFLMADMGSRSAQILTPFLAGFMLLSLTYALNIPDDSEKDTQRKAAGSLCFIGLVLIILYDLYWMTVKDDDHEASDFYYGYHHRDLTV